MRRITFSAGWVAYLSAALGIAAVTALCAPFPGRLNHTTVALAMLLVVLFTASAWGSRPGFFTAALGGLAYDYFFLPPIGTFIISDVQDWVALGALFITAATVGELSASAYNRRLIEADLDPLVTIGRDGRITDANAAAEAITGRSRAKLVGTDFSEYFTDPARARAEYDQAFRGGLLRDYPLEIRRPGDGGLPVLYNASVYRDEIGAVAGVLASAHDVSGLKHAEDEIRRLASFPQLAPLPIIEFDRDLKAVYANPAMPTRSTPRRLRSRDEPSTNESSSPASSAPCASGRRTSPIASGSRERWNA